MRVEFLEREQTQCILEEKELQQTTLEGNEKFKIRWLYIPASHVDLG